MKKLIAIIVVGIIISGCRTVEPQVSKTEEPTENISLSQEGEVKVVAENLQIPWEIIFLPNNDLLVTERTGRLVLVTDKNSIIPVEGVRHYGEGGLLGAALHPNFEKNNWIYLYLTSNSEGNLENRVERYKLKNTTLSDRTVILDSIPGATYHDGGRIAFGPDNLLYITTGDATVTANAQNLDSLAGKILRINDDGSIPSDNPFGTTVYSYGHRNPQSLSWDTLGRLWTTEHGRSGSASGFDEINLIEKGANYGWPTIQGDQSREGLKVPALHSGARTTWAPAGSAYIDGRLFFTGLRGESLYEVTINEAGASNLKQHLNGEYGRLRAVTLGPDGFLYVSTSNTDGRGNAKEGYDKIIKIDPNNLT